MNFLQILVIISLITNFIVLATLYVIYSHQKNLEDASKFFKEMDKLKVESEKKEEKVLSEALRKSKKAVESTLNQLASVENLSKKTKRLLNSKAEKLVEDTISKYNQEFQKTIYYITDSYKEQLKGLENLQNSKYSEVIESAKLAIEKEAENFKNEIANSIREQESKVGQEISDYKEKIKQDLDKKALMVVSDVARKTIGESIDIQKHQELVMSKLEEARRENFI